MDTSMIILFFAVFVVSSLAGIITSKRKEQTVVVPKESEERRRLLAQKDDLTEQLNMLKKENENAERFKQIVINLRDNFPVLSTGTTFPTNNEALMNFLKERLVSKPGYKINEDNFNRFVNENNKEAALLIEKAGIVKAAVAEKAIPYCNIVNITGDELKSALTGYLEIIHEANPASVGGNLPGEDFYFIAK